MLYGRIDRDRRALYCLQAGYAVKAGGNSWALLWDTALEQVQISPYPLLFFLADGRRLVKDDLHVIAGSYGVEINPRVGETA